LPRAPALTSARRPAAPHPSLPAKTHTHTHANTHTQQEEAVQAHIDGSKVAIFSKTYCPYCSRAKALFADTLKVPAGVVELDAMGAEGAAMQQALQARTGVRTVPQVFVAGKLVGGCDG
jgi:glutaredoxin 3